MSLPTSPSSDHDLLIRLEVKLDALIETAAETKAAVSRKVEKTAFDALEAKVDQVRTFVHKVAGGLLVVQVAGFWVLKLVWK